MSEFCRQVLELDPGIRFAGVANKNGRLAAARYRKGVVPLLDKSRLELSVVQSAIRFNTRESFEQELGKALYTITTYERVKRATVPIHDDKKRLLLVSFDITARPGPIIRKKILPLIEEKLRGA
ncbi:hypothetical protein [Nitrososphaera sp.]|uniref:hypothetical protein n=1 Tax=Nitrososphaera sp. TaxID=1971748 RepID=UPI0017D9EBDB|nr:hypothetical protein [Nitrososphaera sp.]NWG38056.1 hypothetical protein [Nitrososphaera sp.]